ncbi:MAG: hypothetical protein J6A28_02295 [Clostridia bacterium]|nr:hypothetical protein [Clostridia bacterium]
MKETKYLSVKSIDVKKLVGINQNIDERLPLDENFTEVVAKAKFDAEHFFVEIARKQIPCKKASLTEVRKVTAGVFKNCYVLIEHEQDGKEKTNVYLLHKDGFVTLAESKKELELVDVDTMLDSDYIAYLTAHKLNTFDLGQENQTYKHFCEKLPQVLFTDKKANFVDSVVKKFFSMGDVNLIPNKNNRFVKTQLCKAEAYNFFEDFSQERMHDMHIGG